MKKFFWLKIVLLAILVGLFAGASGYTAQHWMEKKDENKADEGQSDTASDTQDETKETAELTEPVETENPWADLIGSYTANASGRIEVRRTEISGPVDSIAGHHVIYIDEIAQENSVLWGHTDFCGMDLWISMGDLKKISEQNYSMQPGNDCYVISVEAEDNFRYEASDEVLLMCSIPFGTELTIEEYDQESVKAVYEGKYGWIVADSIAVFHAELPYVIRGTSQYSVSLMREPDFSSDKIGMMRNDTVVKFTEFRNGWGKVTIENYTGWIPVNGSVIPTSAGSAVTNSASSILIEQPVTETEKQTEPPTEEQTEPVTREFYKDGTPDPVDGYILPNSSRQYLSESDLSNLTLKGLCYAKNEVYARYGRKFKSKELQEYFNSQPWYVGLYEPSDATDAKIVGMMNDCERHNKDILYKAESRLGMYALDQ